MKDDLVERCARAMCEDDGDNWDAKSFLDTANGCSPEEQREYWRSKAQAVLAIARPAILEEAAAEARTFAREPASQYLRKGMGLSYRVSAKPLALQAIRIERAIRSLAHTTGQEGGR